MRHWLYKKYMKNRVFTFVYLYGNLLQKDMIGGNKNGNGKNKLSIIRW